jgi:hypothetical protein
MIEKTGTVITIVSEGVRIWRKEHALLVRNGYSVVEAQYGEDAPLRSRAQERDVYSTWNLDTANLRNSTAQGAR